MLNGKFIPDSDLKLKFRRTYYLDINLWNSSKNNVKPVIVELLMTMML